MAAGTQSQMQRTVPLPVAELVQEIPNGSSVFVLGCGDCATEQHFGGSAECAQTAARLAEAGIEVAGWAAPPEGEGTCNARVTTDVLGEHQEALATADVIVLLACAQAEPALQRATDLPLIAGTETVVGGQTGGSALAVEDCSFCAECIAEAAGGLCPHSFCPKHLINGPCGGAQGGRCEVTPRRPCVWGLIHRRLKAAGQLQVLQNYHAPVSFGPAGADDTGGP